MASNEVKRRSKVVSFYDLMSSIISNSSIWRVAGMMTQTSLNVTVVRTGGNPGSANSLLISTPMSYGIRCWYTPLPVSALGRDFGTSGMGASSLESGSETTFFLLPRCLPLQFILLLVTPGWFLVELRKVTRKTGPSASSFISTSSRHFFEIFIPAV